jgi:hypothetical protein
MIALVGGQTLPNILPILHYKPLNTLFIYTSTTSGQYKNLKTVLEKKRFNVYGIESDPYDISAIAKTLNGSLANIDAPFVFNLTGGTKSMSLAAYQIAAEHRSSVIYLQSEKGQSIVDHYIWRDYQLYRQQQDPLPEYLNLTDILDLYLGQGKDAEGKDIWKEKGPTIQNNGGHLFEIAIAEALRSHSYEVMCGVKGSNDQVDIDVVIRYKNQIGIIEAKTGKKNLDGIKQLSNTMRYLGGTYTKLFLVISGEPSNEQQRVCKWLHINIISLLHYQKGMIALAQEDIDTLLTTIDKIMKV